MHCVEFFFDICAVNGHMMEATQRKCTECAEKSSEQQVKNSQGKTTSTEHIKSPKTIQWCCLNSDNFETKEFKKKC